MNKKKSADERPKQETAKRVIAKKRRYFVPEGRNSVQAPNLAEVVLLSNKKVEEGDGDK